MHRGLSRPNDHPRRPPKKGGDTRRAVLTGGRSNHAAVSVGVMPAVILGRVPGMVAQLGVEPAMDRIDQGGIVR